MATDTRMKSEIVDALFGLLDERVAHQFPAEFFRVPAHFLQCLINRHGSHRHRAIAKIHSRSS